MILAPYSQEHNTTMTQNTQALKQLKRQSDAIRRMFQTKSQLLFKQHMKKLDALERKTKQELMAALKSITRKRIQPTYNCLCDRAD